ncbi:hypothetical protein DLM75_07555 [Leptospira stimsonii]|uniref:Uncharacterized protein n=1 Tax=Leptospira stimsonii TaxID=2202203 RepID=A0A396ZHN8_9LEPT|nr:hypothetical protein DLM75_07555 [Leptospira stimsonii]
MFNLTYNDFGLKNDLTMAYDVLNSDPIRNGNKKFPKLLYFSFYNTFVFSVNKVRFKNNLRWTQ